MTTRKERLKAEIDSISGPNTAPDFKRMIGEGPSDGDAAERLAIDILRHRVWDTVRGLAKDALESVMDEHTDADEVSDYIHESCDGACTYTSDCYMMAWLLDTADDVEEFVPETRDPTAIITAVAFANLRAEVESMVAGALERADWETEDEEEDNEG